MRNVWAARVMFHSAAGGGHGTLPYKTTACAMPGCAGQHKATARVSLLHRPQSHLLADSKVLLEEGKAGLKTKLAGEW
jgi:hypothetical protein